MAFRYCSSWASWRNLLSDMDLVWHYWMPHNTLGIWTYNTRNPGAYNTHNLGAYNARNTGVYNARNPRTFNTRNTYTAWILSPSFLACISTPVDIFRKMCCVIACPIGVLEGTIKSNYKRGRPINNYDTQSCKDIGMQSYTWSWKDLMRVRHHGEMITPLQYRSSDWNAG